MTRQLVRLLMLALLTALCCQSAGSARQAVPAESLDNFDIRLSKTQAPEGYLARVNADRQPAVSAALAQRRAAGLARLDAAYPAIEMAASPVLGTPETVGTAPGTGFLTAPSANRVSAMQAFVSKYADVYGLTSAEAAGLEVVASYQNPAGNMGWIELEQTLNGLPVFQGALRGGFTAKGELARTTGVLATGIDAAALPSTPSLTAPQAIFLAAANVGWPVDESQLVEKTPDAAGHATFARAGMADDAKAWLLYFPLEPGVARLAWATEVIGDPMAYLIIVDAEDGSVLFRKNLTSFQTQSATYTVYNDDSPAPLSPTSAVPGSNTQAPAIARTTNTRIGNEAPNTFNNLGWITDGANVTDGNNVEAGVDLIAPDGVDAPTTGASRVFNFPYNPPPGNPAPGDAPTSPSYRDGEVTNMFYWSNVFHDRLYLLGFTEAAHNFQHDNFGRGGVAGDRVRAEAQDSSGTNNANFMTPADGSRGRMQMFVFTGTSPDRTSGIDQEVMLHEMTHGVSNRLHNNAAGLTSNMARGMGEGWSDFYARALLSTADENVNGLYAAGAWSTLQLGSTSFTDNYYYGIRRFPYAVKTAVGGTGNRPYNPLTFADADGTQVNLNDGAFPRSPAIGGVADEVHNLGEIWAMALFEVRARFITRLGYTVGNQRILQFVTDGMKLDPVDPTMPQGRDAILAAAAAGGGSAADIADIWAGFATRGLGVGARVINGGAGNGDARVVESFDQPGVRGTTGALQSESIPNGRLDPGEVVNVSLCLTNDVATASGSVTATLLTAGGVTAPSGPQSFGVVNPGGNVCRTFSFTVGSACGSDIAATVQLQESGGPARTLVYAFQVGALVPSFVQNFDSVSAPSLPAGWLTSRLSGATSVWSTTAANPASPPNRAFVGNPASISDNVLISPVFTLPAGSNRLTFSNGYATETEYDGGVLEIAIAGGGFQDIVAAGGSFKAGGYNWSIPAAYGNPLGGRNAWSGKPGGYVNTIVTLPSAAGGQNVQLRWRLGTDNAFSGDGWSIDDVTVGQIACTPVAPPAAISDSYPVTVNTTLVVTAPGVLGNDTGSAPLTAAVLSTTGHGALALAGDGSFSYTPGPGFTGIDSFTYRTSNAGGPSNAATVVLTVNGPTNAQPPTGLRAEAIAGSLVTLRWNPPAAGPAPTNFVLEGGINPGEVLASIPTGSTAPVFTFAAPTGAFYARVHTLSGSDRSAASNEIRLFVKTPTPPSPPVNLLGLVNGATLSLAWRNTFEGGAPTSLVLDVTGTITGAIPLSLSDGLTVGGVPSGTYTVSLRAVNSSGSSAASSPLTVTFPSACTGAPQAPLNLQVSRSGNAVSVLWDLPAAGTAPTGYVLNVSGAFEGGFPLPGRALTGIVGAGTYGLSVQATNACGASPATPVRSVTVP